MNNHSHNHGKTDSSTLPQINMNLQIASLSESESESEPERPAAPRPSLLPWSFSPPRKHRHKAAHPKPKKPKPKSKLKSLPPHVSFFKLYPELRHMIYVELLGDYSIEIVRNFSTQPWTVVHRKLKGPVAPLSFLGTVYRTHYHEDYPAQSHVNMLALLRTCRQIYEEAVHVLYTSNRFYFRNEEAFLGFARSVPIRHLSIIPSIVLRMAYRHGVSPSGDAEAEFVELMSAMTGLRRLHAVFLHNGDTDPNLELMQLRRLMVHGETALTVLIRPPTTRIVAGLEAMGIGNAKLIVPSSPHQNAQSYFLCNCYGAFLGV